jgi:hypothetical protein
LRVICELLGLPLPTDKVHRLAGRVTDFSSALSLLRVIPPLRALKRYVEQRLERPARSAVKD